MTEKVIIAWSGGKDSALTLHEVQKTGIYEILSLLTTVTKDRARSALRLLLPVLT